MLDKFYDSVADEYLVWMAKEYNVDLKQLKEKAQPLKAKLLSKATDAVSAVKTTKKAVPKSKVEDDSKYGSITRKELIELCKSRSIPVKRKNQDMADLLKAYDEEHESKETNEAEKENEAEEEQSNSDDEEPPLKVEKKSVKVTTKKKSPLIQKNELLEETMESSDEED
jgi:hypothetical protein